MTTVAPPLDRTGFIGGSDIGAVLGINPYKSRLQLYLEKTGQLEPGGENPHTQRGKMLEPIAAKLFTKETKQRLRRANRTIFDPDYPFFAAHIDRTVVGKFAIAEIKCPSLGAFAKIKREGLRQDYIAQMQWYLGLTHNDVGEWIIFCADQWQMLHFPVRHDPLLFKSMWDAAYKFWTEHVIPRVPPPSETEYIDMTLVAARGAEVRRDDAEFVAAMKLLREAKELNREAELIDAAAKARVRELVGDTPGAYAGPGYRLHLIQQQGRSSFDKKSLAGVRPFDRLKVGAVIMPLWQSGLLSDEIVQEIGRCDLDLSVFETRGEPFTTLRPYFWAEGD